MNPKNTQSLPLALQIGEDVFNRRLHDMSPHENVEDVLAMFEEALPAAGTTCATEAVLWAVRSAIQVIDIPIKERDRLLQFLSALALGVDALHLSPGAN